MKGEISKQLPYADTLFFVGCEKVHLFVPANIVRWIYTTYAPKKKTCRIVSHLHVLASRLSMKMYGWLSFSRDALKFNYTLTVGGLWCANKICTHMHVHCTLYCTEHTKHIYGEEVTDSTSEIPLAFGLVKFSSICCCCTILI